jgi:hypothetical protein
MRINNISFTRNLIILAALYAVLIAALLLASNGVPYVMDNNETWSNLGHAKNAFDYGLANSSGLADEGNEFSGQRPDAHPLVHTHQGNFPRLLATALYAAGIRTPEGQIAFVAFTVGLAGVILAFGFLSRILGSTAALVACCFMVTDYLLFLQWQINTWRVWQAVFFFGSLYCIENLSGPSRRSVWPWVGLYVVMACTFYSELVFASFVFMTGLVYTVIRSWKLWSHVVKITVTMSAGAATAAIVLALQLINYYGFDALVQDARYTIGLRNIASDPAQRMEAIEFMRDKNILFLWNFSDAAPLTIRQVINKFFYAFLGTWTPAFVILVGIGCGPSLYYWFNLKIFRREGFKFWSRLLGNSAHALLPVCVTQFLMGRFRKSEIMFVSAAAAFYASLFIFLLSVSGSRIFGIFPGVLSSNWQILIAVSLAGAITAPFMNNLKSHHPNGEQARKYFVAAALLALFAACTWFVSNRLMHEFLALYQYIFCGPTKYIMLLGVLAVATAALYIALGCGMKMQVRLAKGISRCFPLLVSASAGFVAAIAWAPGYVWSGYLDRACPIVSYSFYVLPAVALCTVASLLDARASFGFRTQTQSKLLGIASVAALIGIWLKIQSSLVFLVPPSFASFTLELKKTQYQGAGFAVSNYPVPTAFSSGGWGWLAADQGLCLDNSGPKPVVYNPSLFLIADSGKDDSFARPRYFLQMDQPWSLRHVAQRAHQLLESSSGAHQSSPVVANALNHIDQVFRNRVVAADPSRWTSWSIVELDQKPVPYLFFLEPPKAQNVPLGGEVGVALDFEFVPSHEEPTVGSTVLILNGSHVIARARTHADGESGAPLSSTSVVRGTLHVREEKAISIRFTEQTPDGSLFIRQHGQIFVVPYASSAGLREFSIPLAGKSGTEIKNLQHESDEGQLPTSEGYAVSIDIQKNTNSDVSTLTPSYTYTHEEGVPEGESIWRLWRRSDHGPITLVEEKTRGELFSIPNDAKDEFMFSVIPKDESGRRGFEYFSPPVGHDQDRAPEKRSELVR